jgi:hypothetical protein
MRLSALAALRRDREHLLYQMLSISFVSSYLAVFSRLAECFSGVILAIKKYLHNNSLSLYKSYT